MKNYAGISASDQARQHNGDVYNDCTITYVHKASTVLDAESRCLQSLAFSHMMRRGDIQPKTEKTCDWILRHPQYQEWIENAGLLWIRGRAGSGKSTLMESIVKQNLEDLDSMATDQGTIPNIFVASFFFHRRGEMLQCTTLGLFRSLLHQILRQDREILSEFVKSTNFEMRCREEGEPGVKWDWIESDLRERLKTCVQSFGRDRAVRLYIDALDESGEASARDLMNYFHQLRSAAGSSRLGVCVSCRPYPEVIRDWDQCVVVEHGNEQDIATFLDVSLTTATGWTTQALLDDVRIELARRAAGVFQWVVIVTRRVLSMTRETKEHILANIAKTPTELGDLYESMLGQLSNNDRALAFRILQWIALAAWPLSPEELRHAIAIEPTERVNSSQDFTSSIHWCSDDGQLCDRMLRVSQGLVTVVETGTRKRIQFDHESVQDYMSDRGLSYLERSHPSDISSCVGARGQHYLAKVCLHHLATTEAALSITPTHEDVVNRHASPFVEYAALHWTTHAKKAEDLGVSQADLIAFTEWPSNELWIKWSFLKNGRRNRQITLQHVASSYGLCSVLAALMPMCRRSKSVLFMRNSRSSRWRANATNPKDDHGWTPLSWAASNGEEAAVKVLLKNSTTVNTNDNIGRTPLSLAAGFAYEEIVRRLLDSGAVVDVKDGDGRTPFLWSLRNGHEGTAKLLLATNKVDVNVCDKHGFMPLMEAIEAGSEPIVKLLLATGKVNVNVYDEDGMTPLSLAASCGHNTVVKTLISSGKVDDVNAGQPLMQAAKHGHESVVKTLISSGKVDVNAGQPLMQAAKHGHESIVKCLLASEGIKVSANAFLTAAENGHCGIVTLLLSRYGFDVNTKDQYHQTALIKAARNGHLQVVKLLLSRTSIDVNAKDQYDQTALAEAIQWGRFEVFKLLLSTSGVDVNVVNKNGHTALMNAARLGYYQIAKLLLSTKKADLNVRNFHRKNALDMARREKHWEVVELLEPHFATSD